MTVSNQSNRTSATGTGSTGQEIAFSFPITATSDLTVLKRVTATGVETTLAETTNYTVGIDGTSGGTVTTVTTIETTEQIHIIRDTPMTQPLDLEQGGAFSAENIESGLDRNTKLIIENSDSAARSLTAPSTDDASITLEIPNTVDRASKFLTFDSSGNVTATTAIEAGVISFGAFGTDIAGTASEAAFKALANLEIGTDVQTQDAQLDDIAALAVTDSNFIVGDGTNWVAESGDTVRTSLGLTIGTDVQADIPALDTASTGTIIHGDGTDFLSRSVVCNEDQVVCNENNMLVN